MITFFDLDKGNKTIIKVDSYARGVWVHAEDPNEEEQEFLVKKLGLEKGHIKDALDEDEVPRFETEEKTAYLFTRFPHIEDEQAATLPFLLAVTEDNVITVATHTPHFFNKITESAPWDPSRRHEVVIYFLSEITKLYYTYFNNISKEIRHIKRKIERINNKNIVQFVGFEEILNDFRPSLQGTDNVLSKVSTIKTLSFTEEDIERIEDIHLSNRQLIDNCLDAIDTIRNIREAYTTILSNNLNNVIKLFTSLTVILTVPMIIASLYGMNVALPFSESRNTFSILVLVIVALIAGSLYIFKKNDWL